MSEIPMDKLRASLPAFEHLLLAHGYSLYCIDFTQDFTGVLDREALVDHLEQGELASAMRADVPTILANTGSVGDHVCTWMCTSKAGYTVRTKLSNKVVSNFEVGEVHDPIGGHLADYADCPNVHLHRTFLHPDVQARGCTRIEVSLYTCNWGTSRRTRPKWWWRRIWPWSPPRICRRNKAYLWPSRPPSSGRTWPCASTGVLS